MVAAVRVSIGVAFVLLAALPARAQLTIAAEVDVTSGYSGEEIRAAALQLRLSGEGPARIEFFAEAAWGERWAGDAPVIGQSLSGVDPRAATCLALHIPTAGV